MLTASNSYRMTSLTAIYNTSALFCFLFSVLLLPRSRSNSFQQPAKLVAIAFAALGLLVVALGSGASSEPSTSVGDGNARDDDSGNSKAGQDGWFGNGLAIVGAASYGFYEVKTSHA